MESLAKVHLHVDEVNHILATNHYATVADVTPAGLPLAFAVPYAYTQGKLYFYLTESGYSFSALESDDAVSICVIDAVAAGEGVLRVVNLQGSARELSNPVELSAARKVIREACPSFVLAQVDMAPAHAALMEVAASELKGWEIPRLA
jgi:nitroimidazol reductase NimA-like FMN-containing flavoprotein (pyridoxamine 5'-phosphate oxidase superfamily)